MTRLLMTAALLAACVPPATNSSSTGPAPTAASGGTCDSACARLVQCQLVADAGACVQQCHTDGYTPSVLGQLAAGSCADDGAWLSQQYGDGGGGGASASGGEGSSCTGGDGSCGGATVCCGNSGPVGQGMSGVCHQVSVCNMPRR